MLSTSKSRKNSKTKLKSHIKRKSNRNLTGISYLGRSSSLSQSSNSSLSSQTHLPVKKISKSKEVLQKLKKWKLEQDNEKFLQKSSKKGLGDLSIEIESRSLSIKSGSKRHRKLAKIKNLEQKSYRKFQKIRNSSFSSSENQKMEIGGRRRRSRSRSKIKSRKRHRSGGDESRVRSRIRDRGREEDSENSEDFQSIPKRKRKSRVRPKLKIYTLYEDSKIILAFHKYLNKSSNILPIHIARKLEKKLVDRNANSIRWRWNKKLKFLGKKDRIMIARLGKLLPNAVPTIQPSENQKIFQVTRIQKVIDTPGTFKNFVYKRLLSREGCIKFLHKKFHEKKTGRVSNFASKVEEVYSRDDSGITGTMRSRPVDHIGIQDKVVRAGGAGTVQRNNFMTGMKRQRQKKKRSKYDGAKIIVEQIDGGLEVETECERVAKKQVKDLQRPEFREEKIIEVDTSDFGLLGKFKMDGSANQSDKLEIIQKLMSQISISRMVEGFQFFVMTE